MFNIVLAVFLGIAIIAFGVAYSKYLSVRDQNQLLNDTRWDLYNQNVELRRKLEKRTERHNRASGEIVRQRALLNESEKALARSNQIVELLLESVRGSESDVSLTRNQARRLFVVS